MTPLSSEDLYSNYHYNNWTHMGPAHPHGMSVSKGIPWTLPAVNPQSVCINASANLNNHAFTNHSAGAHNGMVVPSQPLNSFSQQSGGTPGYSYFSSGGGPYTCREQSTGDGLTSLRLKAKQHSGMGGYHGYTVHQSSPFQACQYAGLNTAGSVWWRWFVAQFMQLYLLVPVIGMRT